jgi:SAM-dependent methyltransferase
MRSREPPHAPHRCCPEECKRTNLAHCLLKRRHRQGWATCYPATVNEPASHSTHRQDIEHFDRWAPRYERSLAQALFFRRVHRSVLDAAAQSASRPARILDIGCGTGALLRQAAHRFPGAQLLGVDPSPEMLKVARRLNPDGDRMRFVQAHAEDLPFGNAEFDLVMSTISFHHWADQASGLREAHRLLASGGTFVLADHFVLRSTRLFFVRRWNQRRFHTPPQVEGMLADAGFVELQTHDAYKVGPWRIATAISGRPAW